MKIKFKIPLYREIYSWFSNSCRVDCNSYESEPWRFHAWNNQFPYSCWKRTLCGVKTVCFHRRPSIFWTLKLFHLFELSYDHYKELFTALNGFILIAKTLSLFKCFADMADDTIIRLRNGRELLGTRHTRDANQSASQSQGSTNDHFTKNKNREPYYWLRNKVDSKIKKMMMITRDLASDNLVVHWLIYRWRLI